MLPYPKTQREGFLHLQPAIADMHQSPPPSPCLLPQCLHCLSLKLLPRCESLFSLVLTLMVCLLSSCMTTARRGLFFQPRGEIQDHQCQACSSPALSPTLAWPFPVSTLLLFSPFLLHQASQWTPQPRRPQVSGGSTYWLLPQCSPHPSAHSCSLSFP